MSATMTQEQWARLSGRSARAESPDAIPVYVAVHLVNPAPAARARLRGRGVACVRSLGGNWWVAAIDAALVQGNPGAFSGIREMAPVPSESVISERLRGQSGRRDITVTLYSTVPARGAAYLGRCVAAELGEDSRVIHLSNGVTIITGEAEMEALPLLVEKYGAISSISPNERVLEQGT